MFTVKIVEVTGDTLEFALLRIEVENGGEPIKDLITRKTCTLMATHFLTVRQISTNSFGRMCNAVRLAETYADLLALVDEPFVNVH